MIEISNSERVRPLVGTSLGQILELGDNNNNKQQVASAASWTRVERQTPNDGDRAFACGRAYSLVVSH